MLKAFIKMECENFRDWKVGELTMKKFNSKKPIDKETTELLEKQIWEWIEGTLIKDDKYGSLVYESEKALLR